MICLVYRLLAISEVLFPNYELRTLILILVFYYFVCGNDFQDKLSVKKRKIFFGHIYIFYPFHIRPEIEGSSTKTAA